MSFLEFGNPTSSIRTRDDGATDPLQAMYASFGKIATGLCGACRHFARSVEENGRARQSCTLYARTHSYVRNRNWPDEADGCGRYESAGRVDA